MTTRSRIKLTSRQRFLAGALLAAAFFLIEAGMAEIALARDIQCRAMIDGFRLGFGMEEVCLPEWGFFMLQATSRGVVGLLRPESHPIFAWLTMGVIYALVGAACGQLSTRWGVVTFLLLHVAIIAILAGMNYLSQFIVWP